MEKTDIKSMTLDELTEYIVAAGFPKFRGKQLYDWMHVKLVEGYEEMTNIPKQLKDFLSENTFFASLKPARVQVSKEDGTAKYLFELYDGNYIESVLMHYKHGNSVCISSQAGCRMGCRFCASTLDGLSRSLEPSEMLDQIYRIQKSTGERVTNVVVMGSGEPFDNFDNFVRFEKLLTDENGLNISARNLTVSTCGLVPKIYELADMKLQITLAISLHAPNDEIRSRTMPVNKRWNIDELLKACRDYTKATSRRISFEYAMISGVNDSDECAKELASRLKGMLCHVNLIPVNSVKERDFRRSDNTRINEFIKILEKHGINVTVRRTLGSDINASCGQLRRGAKKE